MLFNFLKLSLWQADVLHLLSGLHVSNAVWWEEVPLPPHAAEVFLLWGAWCLIWVGPVQLCVTTQLRIVISVHNIIIAVSIKLAAPLFSPGHLTGLCRWVERCLCPRGWSILICPMEPGSFLMPGWCWWRRWWTQALCWIHPTHCRLKCLGSPPPCHSSVPCGSS